MSTPPRTPSPPSSAADTPTTGEQTAPQRSDRKSSPPSCQAIGKKRSSSDSAETDTRGGSSQSPEQHDRTRVLIEFNTPARTLPYSQAGLTGGRRGVTPHIVPNDGTMQVLGAVGISPSPEPSQVAPHHGAAPCCHDPFKGHPTMLFTPEATRLLGSKFIRSRRTSGFRCGFSASCSSGALRRQGRCRCSNPARSS